MIDSASGRLEAMVLDADSISLTDTDGADALIDLATDLREKRSLRVAVAACSRQCGSSGSEPGSPPSCSTDGASRQFTRRSTPWTRTVTLRGRSDEAAGPRPPRVPGRVPLRSGAPLASRHVHVLGCWSHRHVDRCRGGAVAGRDALIAALSAAQVPRGLVRVAALVTLVALVVAATAPTSGAEPNGLVALLSALLVGLAPVAIAWSIVRRRRVDVQTVLGALCIYVLLGMFWAFSFAAIGAFGSGPFFAQEASPTSASYLYFAYVTMTTVGYGDLTASGNLGRSVAVLDRAPRPDLSRDGRRVARVSASNPTHGRHRRLSSGP